MVRQHQTSDTQLRIGESRDSGFDAMYRSGMTVVGLFHFACDDDEHPLHRTAKIGQMRLRFPGSRDGDSTWRNKINKTTGASPQWKTASLKASRFWTAQASSQRPRPQPCCRISARRVIKIEPPGSGDPYRNLPQLPGYPHSEHNYAWLLEARNKRSLALDLSKPEGTGGTA